MESYQKREIDHFVLDIKAQLDRIETQTTKTNGRVTTNEMQISQINTRINTTIWAFGITLPVILGLLGTIFYLELQKIQDTLPNVIGQELQSYQAELVK